jgi:hypothetical protein
MEVNQNKDNDVTIVVVSCDKYKDLWTPFFHCFFKYWSDCPYPVYLASNEATYSDSRVQSISIGPDLDYSSNLLKILEHIDTQWLILWFEDAFITSKIDTERILKLVNLAQEDNVGFLKLTVDTPLVFTKDKEQEIGPIPKGVKYRSAIGLALYRKETLIKLLKPGASAWELDKSQISNSLEDPFYALTTNSISNHPISVINGVVKGMWSFGVPTFLKKEGLGSYISNRKVESIWTYLYGKLYQFRLDLLRLMGKYWYD